MKHSQEIIVENLFENLRNFFEDKSKLIRIEKEGAGVHWNCNVILNGRRSKIHCFEHRNYDDIRPEYLISFEESNKNEAWGRTFDIRETIQSASDWTDNKGVDFLHKKYEFVDWYKRKIQNIEEQLTASESELLSTEKVLSSPWGSGLYDYQIANRDRSCELSGYGKNEPISFVFKWDDCKLFEVKQNDLTLLAGVIKKWLIDEIEPSTLENQYDWVEVGDLAKHYEQGEGIKGEFIESWNSIERFYGELSDEYHPFKADALKLLQEMRSVGLDEELRAGQSLFFFILSRSRRHGLEENRPYLHITFLGENKMKVNSRLKNEAETSEVEVKYEGLIKSKVRELLKEKIE